MFHIFSLSSECRFSFSLFSAISLKPFTIAKREPTPTQKRNNIKYLWLNSGVKEAAERKRGGGLGLGRRRERGEGGEGGEGGKGEGNRVCAARGKGRRVKGEKKS